MGSKNLVSNLGKDFAHEEELLAWHCWGWIEVGCIRNNFMYGIKRFFLLFLSKRMFPYKWYDNCLIRVRSM